MRKIIFTTEETQSIINDYNNNHISTNKIAAKFGVSKGVISRILKENNIELRKTNHSYFANYSIFQNIDSSEKAY